MKELNKLKEIFLSPDLDKEDYQDNLEQIKEWESSLIANENLKSWLEHDTTKDIIKRARESYKDLCGSLVQNRRLTQEQRESIYARQDAMLWIISLSSKDPKKDIENIQKQVMIALSNAT